jgi:hypothetical protein
MFGLADKLGILQVVATTPECWGLLIPVSRSLL